MKRSLRWAAWIGAGVTLLAVALLLVARSEWLREQVRVRIVETIETASGGRVLLERFDFQWASLRANVTGLTLRGSEPEEKTPLLKLASASIDIDVRSWFGREIALRSLELTRPEIHIYVNEDGSTNIPATDKARAKNPIESLLDLKIQKLTVLDGVVEYDSKRIPLQLTAEGVRAGLTHVPSPLHIDAEISCDAVRLPEYADVGLNTQARLFADRAEFDGKVHLVNGNTTLRLKGAVESFKSPRVQAQYEISSSAADLRIRGLRGGTLEASGEARWNDEQGFSAVGSLNGRRIHYEDADLKLAGLNVSAGLDLGVNGVQLTNLQAGGFGGAFEGSLQYSGWKLLRAKGTLRTRVSSITEALRREPLPWDGELVTPLEFAGEVTGTGVRNARASGEINISPAEGQLPAEGLVAAEWDQRSGKIRFSDSTLKVPDVAAHFNGTLGESMEVGVFATNLRSLAPYIRLIGGDPEFAFPVRLERGETQLAATVTGPLQDPRIAGRISMEHVVYEDVLFDHLEGRFAVDRGDLQIERFSMSQNGAKASGTLRLGLKDWVAGPESPVKSSIELLELELGDLTRLAKLDVKAEGRARATIRIDGTVRSPGASIQFNLPKARVAGEQMSSVSGGVHIPNSTQVKFDARLNAGGGRLSLAGEYAHPEDNWGSGEVQLALNSEDIHLSRLEAFRTARAGLDAKVGAAVRIRATVTSGESELRSLTGFLEAQEIVDGKTPLGGIRIDSEMNGQEAGLSFRGRIEQSEVTGRGAIRMTAGYPGTAQVNVKGLRVEFLTMWLTPPDPGEDPLPVMGSMDAELRWRGNLSALPKSSAQVTIPQLIVYPNEGSKQYALRNAGSVQLDVDENGVQVRSARFVGQQTALTIAGLYAFGSKTPWDVSMNGTVNLDVLKSFDSQLSTAGLARINANIRGTTTSPAIRGRMTIENASAFYRGLPNGIEQASGTLYFDRDRASIETFTGKTGGGTFSLSGFVGFGKGEVSYRLQAEAREVRLRYPEGVSTVLSAALSLSGSSNASLLSGNVTINRSGFTAQGDLASFIAGSAAPVPVPSSQNDFLRSLQFDVRVRTSPNATFQTDYTQDLQMEADLRVRGSPAKPVVLGNVKVNQGEINFFGNRYTITRGELLFFNAVAIQPSINLDLETRIRGVTVYINVSGPLSRLGVTYRSEPPLQSQEILALLTVGRAPTATSSTVPNTRVPSNSSSTLGEASNTLLGGALSASVSDRMEKFFGASRIKIDPNMTGVENIPQARLTIEQSLSRDITVTYSTNLSKTSQQIVQVEWNLNRTWSMIAVRDENGTFGMDVIFRRRFR